MSKPKGIEGYRLQLPEDYHELREKAARLAESGQLDHPEPEPAMCEAVPAMREAVLDGAKQAVCQDRNAEYGEPIDNLGRWAGALQALGYRAPGGRDLKPHDMAVIMGVGKYARIVQSPEKADHWVDAAGYPAIGFECVTLEDQ